jgi:hypothetical protein
MSGVIDGKAALWIMAVQRCHPGVETGGNLVNVGNRKLGLTRGFAIDLRIDPK